MIIENSVEKLTQGFISENKVIEYAFTFLTPRSGNIIAYDSELQVTIRGEWKFEIIVEDLFIIIKGFEGLYNKGPEFICKIEDLEKKLKSQFSAYDLAGQ